MSEIGQPQWHFEAAMPATVEVGLGYLQLIRGSLSCPGKKIKQVEVFAQNGQNIDQNNRLFLSSLDQQLHSQGVEFLMTIKWRPEQIGKHYQLFARAFFDDGQSINTPLGPLRLIEHRREPITAEAIAGKGPFVAICMATYRPDVDRLQRQIDSILLQSHENWHLIICDDASDIGHWAQIEQICRLDPRRISLIRHQQNLGFYHNFERALQYVPKNADLVAFADQDDLWYPEKLHALIGTLQVTDSVLAYGDMRVVREDGSVVADTYWQGRKNEYKDFDTVFLANTVTGAASVFKHDLLSTLLPFPQKIGDAFHDHWLACVALASGSISYADKPLHDYYQYGDSVIGHCDFKRWTLKERAGSALGVLGRLRRPSDFKAWLGAKVGGGLAIYKSECLRLHLMAETIKLRLGEQSRSISTLNLMNGGLASFSKLIGTHAKILATGRTTDDAEFRLAMGYLARQAELKKLKRSSG